MNHRYKMLAALVFVASINGAANAATFAFDFTGPGLSGSVLLTYEANPNTGSPLGTSPNPYDPIGSFIVTGATGSFSDTTLGLATTITGVVASDPSNPEPTNLLAPASFGHYLVASGVPGPSSIAPGFSYDNLFYPGGSPQTATDYPGKGGFLDIYGLVFTTADGVAVNFWSNGDFGGGATYGAGVTDGNTVLDYVFDGVSVAAVPEPASWAMMVGGFGFIGAALRRRRSLAVSFA